MKKLKTHIYKVDEQTADEVWQAAGDILRKGGLVAFPTETVYGLGANALDEKASAKIYAAKGRPSDNPLIVHIADAHMMDTLARDIPDAARKLADRFWPGPLTMILKKKAIVPDGTTGGLDTVAIRMPSHPAALKLIQVSGVCIAAPSANTSGRPSPTRAEHVMEDMDGKIDMILDGGEVGIGIESTIVDLTGDVPMILRPGYITKEMLSQAIGAVDTDPAILDENKDENFRPKAPGMKYKHYAPKGDLTLVEGPERKVVEKIRKLTADRLADGCRVGIIATQETQKDYDQGLVISIGSRHDEGEIIHNLYHILREMDRLQVDVIYSESFSEGARGQAIMNRLLKAAGHQVIYV